MKTEEWVRKLNILAAQMAEIENTMHPSAWYDVTADLRARYRKLAQAELDDDEE